MRKRTPLSGRVVERSLALGRPVGAISPMVWCRSSAGLRARQQPSGVAGYTDAAGYAFVMAGQTTSSTSPATWET